MQNRKLQQFQEGVLVGCGSTPIVAISFKITEVEN